VFGLCHGLGLATRLQEITLSDDGLIVNLVSFNVGVELGQVVALTIILLLLIPLRKIASNDHSAIVANTTLMACGFTLAGYHLTGAML
ncbi:MAG: HupE/UreJ family protein, partial [Pseudomonadales bacterium]